MPIPDIATARDEVMDHFTTAWNAQTPPVPLLLYDDKERDVPDNASFARIVMRHNERGWLLFWNQSVCRRFRSFGIITVQVFAISGDGLTTSDDLVNVAVNAFEGDKTGEDRVTFRNVSHQEIGQDGPWFQVNVTAEFDYDFIK